MRKYLKEIEMSGILMLIIGVIITKLNYPNWGTYVILIGILLWLTEVVYKAFHWLEYRRDNMVNIAMMLGVIVILIGTMYFAR